MKDINNEFVDIVNFCLDDVDEIGNDILLEKDYLNLQFTQTKCHQWCFHLVI